MSAQAPAAAGFHPSFHARSNPTRPALILAETGETVTYAELERRSNQVAHFLRNQGLVRGDAVAIFLENHPRYLEVIWGAQRAGLVYVSVSSRLSAAELDYILADSGAKLLVSSAFAVPLLEAVSADVPRWLFGVRTGFAGDLDTALEWQPTEPIADEAPGIDMPYSSGTTGRPKGIRRPLPEPQALGAPDTLIKLAEGHFGFGADTVYLSPAPLYHAAPLRWSMTVQALGGTVVLMEKFDPRAALAAIERHRVTHSQWVPTHFVRLLKLPPEERGRFDLSSHRLAVHAAAPCPVEIKRAILEWWGPIVHEYYSSSEGVGFTTIGPEEWLARPGTVGRPLHGIVHVVDEEGHELPPGEDGVIYFETPTQVAYHNDPDKTAAAHNAKGWFTLDDIGHVDADGYLYLTDRRSFMIISGGVNIYPQEIENRLVIHPKVADAAVIGVPDEEMGEKVLAVVQLAPGETAGPALETELDAWCRAELSGVKVPRAWDFVADLPREPTGKLLKGVLRNLYRNRTEPGTMLADTPRDKAVRLVDHVIAGEPAAPPARTGPVYDPSTGRIQAEVALGTAETLERAVAAAARAQPGWAQVNPQRRARVMFRFKELVEANMDDLARLLSSEHGKVLADSRGDIQRGLEVVEFACGIPHVMKGEFTPGAGPGIDVHSLREPIGIGAGITPFNFPAMIPLWMGAVAVACGNAFILKPSERDPSVPNRLAELLLEAGLPEGIFQVVHGDKEMVDAILDHPAIGAVSFVGSSDIAEYVYARGTAAGKRVQAMGGAKNHGIVMPDADLDQVVDDLVGAAFGSAGERCMALSVVVPIGEETAERLKDKLIPAIRALKVGTAADPDAHYGPVVTQAHKDKVEAWIARCAEEGGEIVTDGRGLTLQGHESGFFIGPTLIDHVTPAMESYHNEIFGPVLQIVRARDLDEAIALPSRHQYGNGVAIFTASGQTAREFAARVNVGMVGINVPIPVPVAYYTFGGWKRSGFGDTNQHGMEGVRFWTRIKTVTQRWPDRARRTDNSFVIPTMS
jgi:malonate-semialdehyde dehydrogenase (acetylating)/methylmalonate-semialdehyde dehydrogenase